MKKTLLIFGIIIIACITASAQFCQPKLDTATGATIATGSSNILITWKHKVSGTNRLLVVQVAGDTYCDSVKYAGVKLTRLDTVDTLAGTTKIKAAMWYQLNPPAGTDSVKVFFPAGSGTFNPAKYAEAISFTNVKQTTPFGTTAKYKYNTACPASLLVRSDTNSLVLDMLVDSKWQYPVSPDVTQPSQTMVYSKGIGFANTVGGSVHPGADSVYMNWTWTFCASTPLASIAVPIKGFTCIGNTGGGGAGIKEIAEEVVNLFPNPATTILHYQLNIKNNAGYHLEIIDITGKVLLTEKTKVSLGTNNLEVNVSALSPGIYFLKMTNDNGKYSTARFIKTE